MVLGLLAATSATSSGACARGLVNAEELAPAQIWRAPDFLSGGVVSDVLALLPSAAWYPCPRQEDKWPRKQCSKLDVSTHSSLATVVDKLGAAWGGRLNTSGLTQLPITWDQADDEHGDGEGATGAAHQMRHDYHHDVRRPPACGCSPSLPTTTCTPAPPSLLVPSSQVFPERPTDSDDGPDATNVIYLSEAPTTTLPHLSGQTIFPHANVSVLPRRGALLAWANRCEDGSPNAAATHGVGPFAGTHAARVAIHVPVSFGAMANASAEAFAEHVGCTGPPAGEEYGFAGEDWANTIMAQFGLLRIGTVLAAGLAAALRRARNRVRARALVLHGLTRAGSALPQLPVDVVRLINVMVDASPNPKGSAATIRAATKKLASLGFARTEIPQMAAGPSTAANTVPIHKIRWVRQTMEELEGGDHRWCRTGLRRPDQPPTSNADPPASSAAWAKDCMGKKLKKIKDNTKVVVLKELKPPQLKFSLVATADGRVGYIKTRYLSRWPPVLMNRPVFFLTGRHASPGVRRVLSDSTGFDEPVDFVAWPWMNRIEAARPKLQEYFPYPGPSSRLADSGGLMDDYDDESQEENYDSDDNSDE